MDTPRSTDYNTYSIKMRDAEKWLPNDGCDSYGIN